MTIPVILDTDIGADIDDTWALALMMKSPELDIRLISCATLNTPERAKLVARILEIAGRTDIPIAVGVCQDDKPLPQSPWVADYALTSYPGTIHSDADKAIDDVVAGSDRPVTIIGIGPLTNIADALIRYPRIMDNSRFVGMCGSVYKGYDGGSDVHAEYNIAMDIEAAKTVFTAPWDVTITPLDTCGIIRLDGDLYRRIADSHDPLAQAVIENYRIWLAGKPDEGRSSILFDTAAVYLAFSEEFLDIREVGIRVTNDGFTVPDDCAKTIRCAVAWRDLAAFKALLTERLAG